MTGELRFRASLNALRSTALWLSPHIESARPRATRSLSLMALGAGALEPILPLAGMGMLDSIVEKDRSGTALWIGAEVLMLAAVSALTASQLRLIRELAPSWTLTLSRSLVQAMGNYRLSELEQPEVRDRFAAAQLSASIRVGQWVEALLTIVQSTTVLILSTALLATFSSWAPILVLAFAPTFLIEVLRGDEDFRKDQDRAAARQQFDELQTDLSDGKWAGENALLRSGRFFRGTLRDLGAALAQRGPHQLLAGELRPMLVQLAMPISFYSLYAHWGLEAVHGRLSLGGLTLCLGSATSIQRACENLLAAARQARTNWLHIADVEALVSATAAPERKDAISVDSVRPADEEQCVVQFRDVGFRYPDSDGWALRNAAFSIRKGELVVLVGENGAGKSTLLKLILGLYAPTEGEVLYPRSTLDTTAGRVGPADAAVVFQTHVRFPMSLRDNIVLARSTTFSRLGSLEDAVASSGVAEFLSRLDDGLDTKLSAGTGDGVELSGGQWQKVAIARALIRQSELLVLDEPTSMLSANAEAAFFDTLSKLRRHKTIVLITHRRAAVRLADRVLTLDHGKLTASSSATMTQSATA